MKQTVKKYIMEIIALLSSLVIILPFIMIILNSLKNRDEANRLGFSLPKTGLEQIFLNYSEVIKSARLLVGFKNSFIVTVICTIVVVFVSSMGGFILNRRKDRLIRFINLLIISGLTLPFSVVCCYFLLHKLGLSGTLPGAVLVYTACLFPITVFLYSGFYKSIPVTIDESAFVEGCSTFKMFFKIIFPLVKPVTATVVINTFLNVWNDFSLSIYLLNSPKKFTAVLSIYSFFGEKYSDWNLLFADVVMISLPVVIVYLFLQRYIVDSMTAGAVKG